MLRKITEKDIVLQNNVSPNTFEKVMDSYYDIVKIHKNYLPSVLSFDEFKSVKSANGAMSFNLCNGKNGQIIDIVEDRRLDSLIKYFSNYSHKARAYVKFITIDMYSPYISLIKKMFPHTSIIIDKFHLVQLISRSLNKTRIKVMKSSKKDYNDLDNSKWKNFTCFSNLMTEVGVLNYLLDISPELKESYNVYQDLLYSFKSNDKHKFETVLSTKYNYISDYLKTSIKSLKEFKNYIFNTFDNHYHNGFIESNNNFIKVIKRIAFGFRSFRRFKARIMICKGLLTPKKKAINT